MSWAWNGGIATTSWWRLTPSFEDFREQPSLIPRLVIIPSSFSRRRCYCWCCCWHWNVQILCSHKVPRRSEWLPTLLLLISEVVQDSGFVVRLGQVQFHQEFNHEDKPFEGMVRVWGIWAPRGPICSGKWNPSKCSLCKNISTSIHFWLIITMRVNLYEVEKSVCRGCAFGFLASNPYIWLQPKSMSEHLEAITTWIVWLGCKWFSSIKLNGHR